MPNRALLHIMVLVALTTGCAAARVRPVEPYTATMPLPRPEQILVYDFAVSPDDVPLRQGMFSGVRRLFTASGGAEQLETGRGMANTLSAEVAERARVFGLPVAHASRNHAAALGTLLIEGEFFSIEGEKGIRRLGMQLGEGGAELRSVVRVSLMLPDGPYRVQEYEVDAMHAREADGVLGPQRDEAAGTGTTGGREMAGGTNRNRDPRQAIGTQVGRIAAEVVAQLERLFAAQGWAGGPQKR